MLMVKKQFFLFPLVLVFFLLIFIFLWQTKFSVNNLTLNKLKNPEKNKQTSRLQSFFPSASSLPSPVVVPKLKLESVFDEVLAVNDNSITLITTGDVMAGRSVNFKIHSYNNFLYPWEKTASFLQSADLALINLESPLVKNCPLTNSGMIFCGSEQFLQGLLFARINIVNLSNNHIFNWGEENALFTQQLLGANHILTSGYPKDSVSFKEIKNKKFAFLGYNLLDSFLEKDIIKAVNQASLQADFVVVSLHWGVEYQAYPENWQQQLGRSLIDAGAQLIVGNHPHWHQPIEVYKQGLIIYSHGNFIFDQEWSKETKTGFAAKHIFYENRLVDSQIFPVLISDYCQPSLLEKEEKEKFLTDLKEKSFFWQKKEKQ